jgi:hypothetical protein
LSQSLPLISAEFSEQLDPLENNNGTQNQLLLCPDTENDLRHRLRPRHITIRKPIGDPDDGQEAITLSPDFANYLRREDKSYLLSKTAFADWLKRQEADEQDNNEITANELAEKYRTELQKLAENYEEKIYAQLYAKPKNIPMPGIQRGHRLLKLPIELYPEEHFVTQEEEDSIYQGPLGGVEVPNVDLEELIRRYVNALHLKSISIYNLDDILDNDVSDYFKKQIDLLDPDKMAIFEEATKLAIRSEEVDTFIRVNQDQGRDLTLEDLIEWLLSEIVEPATLKDKILEHWKNRLADVIPDADQGLIEELPAVSEFRRLFIGLCAPSIEYNPDGQNRGKLGPEDAGSAYFDIPEGVTEREDDKPVKEWLLGSFGPITIEEKSPDDEEDVGKSFANAVLKRVDALTDVYDKAWRVAKDLLGTQALWDMNKEDIKYSGYELKAIVSWLVLGTVNSLEGCYFNGRKKKEGRWQGPTNQKAAEYLKDKIEEWQLLISETDIAKMLSDDAHIVDLPLSLSAFYVMDPDGERPIDPPGFTTAFGTLIASIETSYKAVVDVLLSLSPASRITSSITEELDDERVQQLYRHWTSIFAEFIRQYSAKQRISKDKLIFVRLTPRMGKYGEIPFPKAETDKFDPTQILPSHPRVQTEQYMLEPLPQKYACYDFPTLYLREDLSLTIKHLGFGIGANLYSMSLLPEEEQVITVKSFKDTKIKTSESTAENIFEEAGEETSKDFAKEMQHETERESSSQSEFNISGSASAGWGWGTASVESGYSSKSSSRQLAKNASSCTNRLASKLSAKRTVSIETQRTTTTEEELHTELTTERKVKNPNKGHTVTFHWYQMTRKLATELTLEDMKLVYTAGKHNRVAVFGNGAIPEDLDGMPFRYLPDDIGRKLPPDSAIVVHTQPYTEIIPMANANVFLARVFTPQKAKGISAFLWQLIGSDDPAPEGYGIAAFCGPYRNPAQYKDFISLLELEHKHLEDNEILSEYFVPADKISIKDEAEGDSGSTTTSELYLPNLDLRYKRQDGLAPARYSADEFDGYSLPRTLLREEQVINTNGVYCDAMVGRSTALEDYLQRHRDLDLLEKKIEVGGKELDFKWALAKDGMEVNVLENNDTIIGLVKEKAEGEGFKDRMATEAAKLREEKEIAAARLRKTQLAKEIELLKKKIEQLTPPDFKFEAPPGTNVELNVDFNKDE